MEKKTEINGMVKFGIFISIMGFVLLMWTLNHSPNNLQNYITVRWVLKEPVYYLFLGVGGFFILNGIFTILKNFQNGNRNENEMEKQEIANTIVAPGPPCPLCTDNDTYYDYHGNLFCRKCMKITLENEPLPDNIDELKRLKDKLLKEKMKLESQGAE